MSEAMPGDIWAGRSLTLNDRLWVPSAVMDRRVGEETVLLHLASGTYYGLDPVGTRIWELIRAGHRLAEVRERMLLDYDVSAEQLDADLLRLVEELLDQGLLSTDATVPGLTEQGPA